MPEERDHDSNTGLRRLLASLAVAIIVYVAAGAHLGEEGKVLGQTFIVERGWALELAVFGYFFFTLWQLSLAEGVFGITRARTKYSLNYNSDFRDLVAKSSKYRTLIQDVDGIEINRLPGFSSIIKNNKYIKLAIGHRSANKNFPIAVQKADFMNKFFRYIWRDKDGVCNPINRDWPWLFAIGALVASGIHAYGTIVGFAPPNPPAFTGVAASVPL